MVRFIEVEGSHYKMGIKQGIETIEVYEKLFNEMIGSDLVKKVKPKIMPLGLLIKLFSWFSKKMIKNPLIKHTPNQNEFILGLAEGLKINKNYGYMINFAEVITGHPKLTMTWPKELKNLVACTQLFALSEATTDGNDYIARNYDFPNELEEYQMVRSAKPEKGYKTISMTQVCLAGTHHGMNEKGLVIAQNYGRGWRKEFKDYRLKGVPATIIIQAALENCATMEEAVEFIIKFPNRTNGAHYGILDKEGNACLIETTATRPAFRYPENGILTHTNLYMTEELMNANIPDSVNWKTEHMTRPYHLSPQRRYERANELINKMKGKLNREELYKILSDHNNREPDDDTVCTHGEVGSTLATITAIPKKMEFWVTDTYPCKSQQEKFTI
jgi:predicted choloylglycine hydrolase